MTPPAPPALPYRPCVGIAVFNREGRVWAGKRLIVPNGELSAATQLWQMPQGGIDPEEEPRSAAERELFEETGMRSVALLGESADWINYDLPADLVGIALKGRFKGQTQKWFAFRFEGDESEIQINPPPGGHEAEFDDWAWKPLDEILSLVVPFKRGVYEQVVSEFRRFEQTV